MIYIKHGPVLMKQDDEVEYIYIFNDNRALAWKTTPFGKHSYRTNVKVCKCNHILMPLWKL